MKNLYSNSKLIAITFLLIAFSISCDKDDVATTGGAISSSSDKAALSNTSQTATDDLDEIREGEGTQSAESFMNLILEDEIIIEKDRKSIRELVNSGELVNRVKNRVYRDKVKTFLNALPCKKPSEVKHGKTNQNDGFDFYANTGTYTWNSGTETWIESRGVPHDKIVIKFPANEHSPRNNAVLTVYNYDDVTITSSGGYTDTYPTSLDWHLKVDGKLLSSLYFRANFNGAGELQKLDFEFYLMPVTLAVNFENMGIIVTAGYYIRLDGDQEDLLGAQATVTFASPAQEDVTYVEGYQQYRILKFAGTVNVDAIDRSQGDDDADILNQYVNINVLLNNAVAGHLYFVEEGGMDSLSTSYTETYILFNDGTMELAEDYLDPIIESLEDNG